MTPTSLNQLLTVYTWFPLAAVLIIFYLIARLHQKTSGERTYFRWFGLPVLVFALALGRYAAQGIFSGDVFGDGLLALAGVVTMVLCVRLARQMAAGR